MDVIIDGVKYVPVPDIPKDKSMLSALDIRFDSEAGDNLTVRDYLRTLLETLWQEGTDFNGKRPFGRSGWESDLYKPLITNGFIAGELDEDGYIKSCNDEEAKKFVSDLIIASFHGVQDSAGYGQWIPASQQMPSLADADDEGEVWWCNPEHVRRETVFLMLRDWDWNSPMILSGYWMRTGVKRPAPPRP